MERFVGWCFGIFLLVLSCVFAAAIHLDYLKEDRRKAENQRLRELLLEKAMESK